MVFNISCQNNLVLGKKRIFHPYRSILKKNSIHIYDFMYFLNIDKKKNFNSSQKNTIFSTEQIVQ